MEPITMAVIFFIGLLFGGAAAIVTFWNRILEFAERHLIPFIERHLPRILPYIRQIFVDLTKATLATKRAVKWAWQQVKPFLVQVLTEYRYTSGNIWVRSITAWVIQRLDSPSHMMRLHEEEEVPMLSLIHI